MEPPRLGREGFANHETVPVAVAAAAVLMSQEEALSVVLFLVD